MKKCGHERGAVLSTFLLTLHLRIREMESQNGKQEISFVSTALRNK